MILSELRAQGWKWAAIVLAVACIGLAMRLHFAEATLATAQLEKARAATNAANAAAYASEAARDEEATRQRYATGVAEAYEKGKRDAQAAAAGLVSDLRAGTVRLSRLWRGCENAAARGALPGPAGDPAEPDATDGLRFASAGRIVGVVAACQAERDALLNLAEADRAPVKTRESASP